MISVGKTPVIIPFNKINDDFLTFGQYDPKYLDAGGANRPPPLNYLRVGNEGLLCAQILNHYFQVAAIHF